MLAGIGDFQKWLADQDLRRDQQALQNLHFQQGLAQRAADRAADQHAQLFNIAQRNQAMAWQRQNELSDQDAQRQWQADLFNARRNQDVADQSLRREQELADLGLR